MRRHYFKRLTDRLRPFVDRVTAHPWVARFAPALADPDLWHLNRRSTARAVAIGLFCGLVPGPLQVLSAIVLTLVIRANLPLAAITTLYTNPFTIVPLYLIAYEYGALFVNHGNPAPLPSPPPFTWGLSYLSEILSWAAGLGKPLLVGLPLLGLTLAVVGWAVVRLAWRWHAVAAWRRRPGARRDTA